ncbi:hypothetical protein N0V90_010285 [Kalmusia sp. IMI 367209]|nr:hypothetical protein N0V90_010285 [Kalmusia sp. IMI 367209]
MKVPSVVIVALDEGRDEKVVASVVMVPDVDVRVGMVRVVALELEEIALLSVVLESVVVSVDVDSVVEVRLEVDEDEISVMLELEVRLEDEDEDKICVVELADVEENVVGISVVLKLKLDEEDDLIDVSLDKDDVESVVVVTDVDGKGAELESELVDEDDSVVKLSDVEEKVVGISVVLELRLDEDDSVAELAEVDDTVGLELDDSVVTLEIDDEDSVVNGGGIVVSLVLLMLEALEALELEAAVVLDEDSEVTVDDDEALSELDVDEAVVKFDRVVVSDEDEAGDGVTEVIVSVVVSVSVDVENEDGVDEDDG